MESNHSWMFEGCSNCSSANNDTIYDCSDQSAGGGFLRSAYFQAMVTIMYSTIFLVALLGNGAVCFIVRAFPRMRTVTNYFIANLALGDILMSVFCVPFSFVSQLVLNHWPFGGVLCRLVNYSQAVSVLVSAYTLVALAADRCRAITSPLRPRLSKPAAQGAIAAVWVGALATAAPIPIVSALTKPTRWYEACQRSICREEWPLPEQSYYYSMALMALQFVVPLAVLVFTYTRIAIAVWGERPPGEAENSRDKRMAKSKRKMIKMMLTVVIVFTVCWLPLNILIILWSINVNDTSWDSWEPLPYVWFAFHWLAMSHSCYNPIIYCYMNARFRYGFIQVAAKVPCLRGCLGRAAQRAARGDLHNGVSGINMTETSLHRVNTGTTYISLRRRAVRCSCSPSLRVSASTNCSPCSARSRSTNCSPSKSTCSSAVGSVSPTKTRHSIPDQCPHARTTFSNTTCGAENCINKTNSKTSSKTFLPIPEMCDNQPSDHCERRNSKSSLSPNSCIQESLAHGRGLCHSASPSSRSLGSGRNGGLPRDRFSPVRAASLLTPQGVLSYSGQDCKRIPPALNKMYGDKVECLDLSFNSLVSLDGLNGFPSLRDLILDNNRLVDVRPLPNLPCLQTLSLNNNLITNMDSLLLRISEQLPNLTYLSLLGNPSCPDQLSDREKDDADYQRYRYYVLHHLPGLKFLDSRRVSREERAEARRRGQFLRVRRPPDLPCSAGHLPLMPAPFSPLPLSTRRPQHKGAYGKCLYKYSGKHSEGNRFICNADL